MTLLVRGNGLIDGSGTGFRPGVGVLVEGDRILQVGPEEKLSALAEETLDLSPATLVPGLVDAHSHITIRPGEGDQHGQLGQPAVWQALRGARNLRRVLASGVTTMRVMGEEHGLDFECKHAVERGDLAGPRLLVAGRGLSPSHGHGSSLKGVDGPEDLRKAVRASIRLGADHIKIFATGGVSSRNSQMGAATYTREEIRAVVEEAQRSGRRVAAHAHGGEGVDLCAEEGVWSIEHGSGLSEENIERMLAGGTWLVLTSTILFHPTGIEQGDADEPSIMAKVLEARKQDDESFERVKAAGIRYALGTDSMHGLFGYELEWLVSRGVDAEDALIAATRRGAEVVGLDGELGTLEPGKRADIVALAGNPLEDIRAIYAVSTVIKDGRQVVANGTVFDDVPDA